MQDLPMEKVIARLEAINLGESEETRDSVIASVGEWWVREAEDWIELTNNAN